MKISIISLFPQMFEGPFNHSIIQRAKENNLVEINFINLRDFGIGLHKQVDDTPYGGGNGMVLRADVVKEAIEKSKIKKLKKTQEKVILLSAHGQKFNQEKAIEFSKLKHLIIICGHYEGFDERIKKFIDLEISIGDFILTGGEIPAMLITDCVLRLISGVIKDDSSKNESFNNNLLEHPHYTKPQKFDGESVPEVLLSGNHLEINKWREEQSVKVTKKLRPDLLKR